MSDITAPAGYDATTANEHASRVLRYLLALYPNQVIRHSDVCDVLGYKVTPQATSNAATRLRAGAFGLNIASRGGRCGGYVLLVPVPSTSRKRCGNCWSRALPSATPLSR